MLNSAIVSYLIALNKVLNSVLRPFFFFLKHVWPSPTYPRLHLQK